MKFKFWKKKTITTNYNDNNKKILNLKAEPVKKLNIRKKPWLPEDPNALIKTNIVNLNIWKIQKIYKHKVNNFKFERILHFFSFVFLICILCLFIFTMIAFVLNIHHVTDKFIKFLPDEKAQSENTIQIVPNLNLLISDAEKNSYIKYDVNSEKYLNNFTYSPNDISNIYWKSIIASFNDLYQKINHFAKINNLLIQHSLIHKDPKNFSPSASLDQIYKLGISFYGAAVINTDPNENDFKQKNWNDYFKYFYFVPKHDQNKIDSNVVYLPVPQFLFRIDSYYANYDENLSKLKKFEKEIDSLITIEANKPLYDNNNLKNYFYNYSVPNDNNNTSITSPGLIYNIAATNHDEVLKFFKATIVGFVLMFLIVLLYVWIRYGFYNFIVTLLVGVIGALLLIGLLPLIFPISLFIYVLFAIFIILMLFNIFYFINHAQQLLAKYVKNNKLKFAKLNDIKIIAFNVLYQMKFIFYLQTFFIFIIGTTLTITFHFALTSLIQSQFWHFGVELIISCAITQLFIISFLTWSWIKIAFHFVNQKKVATIQALMYQRIDFNEQEVPGINAPSLKVNLVKLEEMNPELNLLNKDAKPITTILPTDDKLFKLKNVSLSKALEEPSSKKKKFIN